MVGVDEREMVGVVENECGRVGERIYPGDAGKTKCGMCTREGDAQQGDQCGENSDTLASQKCGGVLVSTLEMGRQESAEASRPAHLALQMQGSDRREG